jgi:hypothetical protein
LRAALVRLEGQARSRVSTGWRNRKPAAALRGSAARERAAKPTSAPARAPRGQNKPKARRAQGWTDDCFGDREGHGIGTATASTMLTKMAKTGELAKAERRYKLPQ